MATPKSRGRPPHADVLTPAEWRVVEGVRHGMSNPQIDEWYELGRKNGASGGKLVGAGGGGFLLFYSEAKADLRAAMSRLGLPEVRFSFDYEGSTLVVV